MSKFDTDTLRTVALSYDIAFGKPGEPKPTRRGDQVRAAADKIDEQAAEIASLRAELAEAKAADMFWDADDTENMINDVESYPEYVGMDVPIGMTLEVELECAKRLTNKFARWSWNENDKQFEFIGLFDAAMQEE